VSKNYVPQNQFVLKSKTYPFDMKFEYVKLKDVKNKFSEKNHFEIQTLRVDKNPLNPKRSPVPIKTEILFYF